MGLARLADLEEDNDRLRDQFGELETENGELKAEIRELKAQLDAKEDGATTHREIESRNGYVWQRNVTVIAPEWERLHEVGA